MLKLIVSPLFYIGLILFYADIFNLKNEMFSYILLSLSNKKRQFGI